jgi:hypothetical protein
VIYLHVEIMGNDVAPSDPRISALAQLAHRLEGLAALQDYGLGLPDQHVHIALADTQMMQHWTLRPDILGCHVITAGRFANQYYIDRHLCLINMSEALFACLLEEDCRRHGLRPQDSVASWLVTLPHEVAHVAEFIKAGQGRTPQALFLQSDQDHLAVQEAAGCEDFLAEADETSALECQIEKLAQRWYWRVQPAPETLERIVAHFSGHA